MIRCFKTAFETMKYLLNWHLFLRFLSVGLLFTCFVWKFAIPSFEKFLDSGVMVDKIWAPRQPEDSPSFTFCALNNNELMGWKSNKSLKNEDWFKSAISDFCNNPTTVDDAMDCLDKQTFNLTETIKTTNLSHNEGVGADNELWTQDISETHQGRVFRIDTFISFKFLDDCSQNFLHIDTS